MVRVPDGVSARAAVDATTVGWFANPAVPGSHLMAVPDPVVIEDDPEWPALARQVLLDVNPDLKLVEGSGELDDGVGPVVILIYSNEVQLMPKKRWQEPDDMDGFAVMWDYCVALADHADCVGHDPDEDLLIDTSLDLRTARSLYRWI